MQMSSGIGLVMANSEMIAITMTNQKSDNSEDDEEEDKVEEEI
jgi:hypothetical protein